MKKIDPMFDTIKKRLEAAECFLKKDGKVIKLQFHIDRYSQYENLMIQTFEDGFPYARITVNIKHLPITMFAVDTNNFPEAEALLKSNGVAHNTGLWLHSGYCEYPVYELEKWVYEE